jgi:tetratricopeptide (TPR) repeat protein
LGNVGNCCYCRGAIDCSKAALSACREVGDRRGEARALGNLGMAYNEMGQIRRAIGYFEKALVVATESGDRR